MREIQICFNFGGVGHGNISVFPSQFCEPYLQENPGSKTFSVMPGDYLLRIQGVVGIEGATVKILEDTAELASLNLPTGYFSMPLSFTVS